ncbi:hypothetical protein CSA37_02985 [Candidatus Fermentibacteria bacterium]|nr:MAG: hypothetical protein CSA37_02985 [Candidatus Fermentibacteria bacterium]
MLDRGAQDAPLSFEITEDQKNLSGGSNTHGCNGWPVCCEPARITLVSGPGRCNTEYIYISNAEEDDRGLSATSAETAPGDSTETGVEPAGYGMQVDQNSKAYTVWKQGSHRKGLPSGGNSIRTKEHLIMHRALFNTILH